MMHYLEIEGNAKLGGEVAISGAKNIGDATCKFGREVRIYGRSYVKNQLKLR